MSEATHLSHADTLAQYLGAFVDELVAAGLEHVCLCPGSRSTPLALTFARHPGIKVWTHLDERSCAYFALGLSNGYNPVAILCSSGTAAVNFAPAVVEASQSHLPLLVLTADRPQELRDLGANQVIDQVRLYGSAVKWFVEMPLPEASDSMLRYVRMVGRRAITVARDGGLRGPVHLNFPFREPLVPAFLEKAPVSLPDIAADVGVDERDSHEVEEFRRRLARTNPDYVGFLGELKAAKRGVFVCGPDSWVFSKNMARVGNWLGFPVLADVLSGCRETYSKPESLPQAIIGSYDSFLRSPALVDELEPDLIVRLGKPPTSKPLASYLQKYKDVRQLLFAPPGAWPDPDLTADQVHHMPPSDIFRLLVTEIGEDSSGGQWLDSWLEAEKLARSAEASVIESDSLITEPAVITELASVLPDYYSVFAGNSMPVRDLDSFWPVGQKNVNFMRANRGASGIDGVVSTALGAAALTDGKLVLVIGDLSFYHDMNGLLAAKRFGLKATIVLINNDGGGIFSFLPQNEDQEHFEQLFGTPHGLDFEPVAQLYGLGWTRVTTRAEYRAALKSSFDSDGVNVIEVKTNRVENLKLHQRIWDEVAKAVVPIAIKAEP